MVIRRRRGTDEFVIDRIPTIAPRSTDDGRCVFLTADERCSVHPVAPFGCSFFDAHMPGPEGDRRSQWGLVQIERSEAYAALRRELAEIEEPAVAFTAVLADQGWGLGVAEAGVAGYTPVQTTTWPTFEAAEKVAESLNTKLGLTREAAWRIVGSSMAAGRAK